MKKRIASILIALALVIITLAQTEFLSVTGEGGEPADPYCTETEVATDTEETDDIDEEGVVTSGEMTDPDGGDDTTSSQTDQDVTSDDQEDGSTETDPVKEAEVSEGTDAEDAEPDGNVQDQIQTVSGQDKTDTKTEPRSVEKTVPQKAKKKIDTSKTDSDSDKAPADLKLDINTKDRTAVLDEPNSPLNASEIKGTRRRLGGKYTDYLLKEYQIEFSDDFALIMEEIENDFELSHGLITRETHEMRQDNLERGVVFGPDESSALAKASCDDEMIVLSTDEVELLTAETDDQEFADQLAYQATVATYHYRNWGDILAVYIAGQKKAGAEKVRLNKKAKPAIAALFAEMNDVEITDQENLIAVFKYRTAEEYIADKEAAGSGDTSMRERIADYLDPGFLTICAAECGSRQLTLGAMEAAYSDDPEKAVSAEREAVVLAAQTLNGKIHYFWGGKYNHIGWNKAWATPKIVTSAGSSDSGSLRLLGMDCSGFVSWSFINGFGSEDAGSILGQGTASQWVTSEPVTDEEAQIGDLVFLHAPNAGSINHVGILVGRDEDGDWMAIHCNGSDNNVSVERAYDAGFRYIRRPVIYQN